MAISKRTRFEVLRRDDYTCRYCRSSDNPLTIDHVVPVALGGSDAPDNLVAACRDCNAGKASTSPDDVTVAQVTEDAIRWAKAMSLASKRAGRARVKLDKQVDEFRAEWDLWQMGNKPFPLPADWREAIRRQLEAGLTVADLIYATEIACSAKWVDYGSEFRYFMGVCKGMLADRAKHARDIIAGGGC